jgi:hypothetical protein
MRRGKGEGRGESRLQFNEVDNLAQRALLWELGKLD